MIPGHIFTSPLLLTLFEDFANYCSFASHAQWGKSILKETHDSSTTNQSFLIIETIKEEINGSQNILMHQIIQLEPKCGTAHEQWKTLHTTIENQILPHVSSVSGLFVAICQQLVGKKFIDLSDQQLVQLSYLCSSPTTIGSAPPQSFSPTFSLLFKMMPSTPPLPDTLSSKQHISPSFSPLLSKTNEHNVFANSHTPLSWMFKLPNSIPQMIFIL